jgi:hypothetical protein
LRDEDSASRTGNGDALRRVLIGLGLGLTTAAANAACPPGEADGALLKAGDLVLAYRPLLGPDHGANSSRIPMARHFALEVQLCDPSGASAARLRKADATMPEHKHGMNYRPVVTALGAGRFRVEGMMFHMAGHWQLTFEVQTATERVRLAHDVQIE